MHRTLPRFDFRVDFAGLSDVGVVRSNNEDVFRIEPPLALFIVCDGMGGHAAGEVAAALAAEAFVASVRDRPSQRAVERYVAAPTLEARRKVLTALRHAAEAANQRVLDEGAAPERRGMGCTLDAVLLVGDRAFVAHAGDSRVYLARPHAAIQLTHDHGLHEAMQAQGTLSGRAPLPAQNPLVNAVGLSPKITVDTMSVDLARGDRLILCSDGVHGQIGGEAELAQLARAGTAHDAVRALIDTALVRGGRDNATAIVIDVGVRFVARDREHRDGGLGARDLATVRVCPLFTDLPAATVLRAMAAAVEVELAPGETLPRVVASDQVAYVVLDGSITSPDGRTFSDGTLVYPESLVGEWKGVPLWKTSPTTVRALRLRGDDFREVCSGDLVLAAALYERLARHLARLR